MAIQTIRDKNGNPRAFQVQIRIRGEKTVTETFPTFEAAEEFEQNTMRAIRAARGVQATRREYGRQMKPVGVAALAAMPFARIADEFAKEEPDHQYAPYANRLKELVGNALVCDFDKKWTKAFCEKLRKLKAGTRDNLLSEGTISQYIAMVRRMCNWKAEGLDIEKPRLGLTTEFLKPGWDDGRERRLEGDEESRIRAELGQVGSKLLWGKKSAPGARSKPWPCARHYQLLFDFAIETCAREEEMVELPWREVNLERRVWTLPACRSKTKRRRKIYLTPRAMDILGELRLDTKQGSERVFNRLPTVKSVGSTYHNAILRLEIEDLVFHDLKHEGISRHRAAKNFEPEVLMKMAGHSSPKMTMRYFNPSDEEVLANMEAAMLRRHVSAPPSPESVATAEKMLAGKLEGLLSSLAANALDLGDDPALAQTRLATQVRDILTPASKKPLRL